MPEDSAAGPPGAGNKEVLAKNGNGKAKKKKPAAQQKSKKALVKALLAEEKQLTILRKTDEASYRGEGGLRLQDRKINDCFSSAIGWSPTSKVKLEKAEKKREGQTASGVTKAQLEGKKVRDVLNQAKSLQPEELCIRMGELGLVFSTESDDANKKRAADFQLEYGLRPGDVMVMADQSTCFNGYQGGNGIAVVVVLEDGAGPELRTGRGQSRAGGLAGQTGANSQNFREMMLCNRVQILKIYKKENCPLLKRGNDGEVRALCVKTVQRVVDPKFAEQVLNELTKENLQMINGLVTGRKVDVENQIKINEDMEVAATGASTSMKRGAAKVPEDSSNRQGKEAKDKADDAVAGPAPKKQKKGSSSSSPTTTQTPAPTTASSSKAPSQRFTTSAKKSFYGTPAVPAILPFGCSSTKLTANNMTGVVDALNLVGHKSGARNDGGDNADKKQGKSASKAKLVDAEKKDDKNVDHKAESASKKLKSSGNKLKSDGKKAEKSSVANKAAIKKSSSSKDKKSSSIKNGSGDNKKKDKKKKNNDSEEHLPKVAEKPVMKKKTDGKKKKRTAARSV
ncbi:unnamed protein product [Amoebophrya sp. A120]|nr:unnamed protein product [Amoebophrya sp. A120]|eukprot:GSA120T00024434001.1